MTPGLTIFTLTLAATFAVAIQSDTALAATDKGDIPQPAVLSKGSPAPVNSTSRALGTTQKSPTDSSLYWYDGNRKRLLSLDAETLADFGNDPQRPAATPKMIDQNAATLTKGQSGTAPVSTGVSPMFKDASSGQYAGALPGGVMVRTHKPMDTDSVMSIARAFGSSVLRPIGSPTGEAENAHDFWLFQADAGMATLELANRIHESGQVSSAAPNWWKPRQRK